MEESVTRLLAQEWRRTIVGVENKVPLLNGSWRTYVNLDNAATTPATVSVQENVNRLLEWYSSIHRGTGFKSRVSTDLYEHARDVVLEFVGGKDDERAVVFTKNTTESINVLANSFPFEEGDILISSVMEHHANLLPWRDQVQVKYISIDEDRMSDLATLKHILEQNSGVRLVAISGASNVTGYTPKIHEIAKLVHEHGALLMVDGAQLVPHRPVDMRPMSDPSHIDFLVFSGHKMYAPFGSGVLIGPRKLLEQKPPYLKGGGAVKFVTLDGVEWGDVPERLEAGSPNVVGVHALASAIKALSGMKMTLLEEREFELTAYLYKKLKLVPGVRILADSPSRDMERIGVISFVIENLPSMLVASILGHEYGIGLRAGCFCAHPYLIKLLEENEYDINEIRQQILQNNYSHVPTALRVSLGFYNLEEEIDYLTAALEDIVNGRYKGKYELDDQNREYLLQSSFHLPFGTAEGMLPWAAM